MGKRQSDPGAGLKTHRTPKNYYELHHFMFQDQEILFNFSFSGLHSTSYTTETQNQTSMQFYSQEGAGVKKEGRLDGQKPAYKTRLSCCDSLC